MLDRPAPCVRVVRAFIVLVAPWVGGVVASAGCSDFGTTASTAPEPLQDGEASTNDGPTAGQGEAGGVDAPGGATIDTGAPPGHVEYSEGFEGGCTLFTYRSVLSHSSVARTGGGACRVCAAHGEYGYTVDTGTVGMGRAGTRYRARAWVRSDPSSPLATNVSMKIRAVVSQAPFDVAAENEVSGPSLTDAWQEIRAELEFPVDAGINFYVGANSDEPGATCFLVDDLTVERLP